MITVRLGRSAAVSRVAIVTAFSLLVPSLTPVIRAQAPAASSSAPQTAKPASATPAQPAKPTTTTGKPAPIMATTPAAAAAQTEPPDGGWPRGYSTAQGAAVVLYQPQVSSWEDQRHIVLYSAVSYMAKGAKSAALGTLRVESETSVALAERLVSFTDFKIVESNFPTLSKEQVRDLVGEITAAFPKDERFMALDRVLENVDKSLIIPRNIEGVKADPPTIFFSKTPAVLVNIDGDTIWSPIPNNDLRYAVNTNWELFEHAPTKTFYLLLEGGWLKATDIKGPWSPAGDLPESFKKLPVDENFKEARGAVPGKKIAAEKMPAVFVSTTPAEMILLRGEPAYVAVQGAGTLTWVSNTDADVFRMGKTGPVYFLVSGRWFSSPNFTGPWTFATPKMPAEFQKIPLEHERSRVLAAVPGTPQANEAVMLAQIPQTARVKKNLAAPEVAYQGGDPKFEPIEKTKVSRAVNTDKDIIKVGDMYYMCFDGVWFMGTSPTGPWKVTGNVPGEIYEIPISSPSYPVTYVKVEEDNDDEVLLATTLAFTGMMVAWGCVVWGSGYYYPPYVWYGGGYPYYRPYYPSYGYGASYNPWTGAYTRGMAAYGPYGGAGVAARYNPRTGTYSRGAAAYGPYGSSFAGQAYNPRTGAYGQTRQGSNVYGSWGSSSVQRGDSWAQTAHVTNRATGSTTAGARTSGGGAAVARSGAAGNTGAVRTGSGDMYAGHDGNVYRNTGDGWQKSDGGGGWSDASGPSQQQRDQARTAAEGRQGTGASAGTTAAGTNRQGAGTDRAGSTSGSSTASQLDRDRTARSSGTQRTSNYGTAKSSGRTSTYRPSGGARSGGGRRR